MCLTATAKKGVFIKNTNRPGIYDLMRESGSNFPFSYFRLSLPRSEYLIKNKAVYVAESFNYQAKTLNTGLRQTTEKNIYQGDIFNPQTKKRSLILFHFMDQEQSIIVYLFENHFPKNLQSILKEIIKND